MHIDLQTHGKADKNLTEKLNFLWNTPNRWPTLRELIDAALIRAKIVYAELIFADFAQIRKK